MRARSSHVHGCTFDEPRNALANPQGRMPGGRVTWGVFLWLPFFAQANKVTRSSEGRAEALHLKAKKRSKELDSGFRRNDEQRKDEPNQRHWIPAFAGMTSNEETS